MTTVHVVVLMQECDDNSHSNGINNNTLVCKYNRLKNKNMEKLTIEQEIALRIINGEIQFLDKYYTKRFAEIKKETAQIEKEDGWNKSALYEAAVFKSSAEALFETIQKTKKEFDKNFNYE